MMCWLLSRDLRYYNDRTNFLNRLVFLNGVVRALNYINIETSNKTNMGALDRLDTEDGNRVDITIKWNSEDKVVSKVKSNMNIEVFYKLNLLILKDNYSKNFSSYNFANVLANLFGNLSSTLRNFCFSSIFFIYSFYSAVSDSTSSLNLLVALPIAILVIFLLFITDYILI